MRKSDTHKTNEKKTFVEVFETVCKFVAGIATVIKAFAGCSSDFKESLRQQRLFSVKTNVKTFVMHNKPISTSAQFSIFFISINCIIFAKILSNEG